MLEKALYVLFPDYNMIDKAIDAGINTLIVAANNVFPWEDEKYNYWGRYTECSETAKRYLGKAKLIYCPVYFHHSYDLPKEDCLVEKDENTVRRRTPCPSSYPLLRDRMLGVLDFCHKHKIKEVIFDPEAYLHKEYDSIQEWNNHIYRPALKCYCPRCKKFSKSGQWRTFEENMRHLFCYSGVKTRGHLLLNHPWTFGRYHEATCWLESTYTKFRLKERYKLWWRNLYSTIRYRRSIRYMPGAWIEYFKTDDEYIGYLYKLMKSNLFSGYWIYSQVRMTANDWHVEEGYLNDTKVDDSFFEKLKVINNG